MHRYSTLKNILVASAALITAGCSLPGNLPLTSEALSLNPPSERALIDVLSAETLSTSCDQGLQEARDRVAEFARYPEDRLNTAQFLNRWDEAGTLLENIVGPIYLQAYVHPDAEVRAAGEACILKIDQFENEVYQNEDLYARVQRATTDTPEAKKLQQDMLLSFLKSGINLPAAKREEARQLRQTITQKAQAFQRNLRNNKGKLSFSEAEVDGLPESWKDANRQADGSYQVGYDYPQYFPFMRNASNADARKRYYIAFSNRGGTENPQLLDDIVALRQQLADLAGIKSFAHMATRDRMVKNPETVTTFLDKVAAKVHVAEKADLEQLRAFKAEREDTALESTTVNRWDVRYFSEQLKQQRYSVNQEELRQYFPTDPVIRWALDINQALFGLYIQPAKIDTWHEDVRYYDVFDSDSKAFIGGIYLDLFPRDGKYKHAAAFPVRSGSTLIYRKPISVLVTNFDRKGLTQNEMETLMHELGHVFHGVLSKTKYSAHSGTSVKRDFVEAPSQALEAWAQRYETLSKVQDYCGDCPAVTPALVEKLDAARTFGKGSFYSRQHLYASFDMTLFSNKPQAAQDLWAKMEGATPLGHIEGTRFPATFGHIVGGYAAGYYGYMWSEVMAKDFQSAFGDNLMDADMGRRYRDKVLSRGGEVDPEELIIDFLGRPANSDAFFEQLTQ